MADPRWIVAPLKLWDDYPVTGPFGATTPPWSPDRPHMGLDIGVSEGFWLYAPAAGKAVEFLNNGSFGNGVCIDVPDTPYYSLFAHMSRVDVKPGDTLTAGQRVGLSGRTSFDANGNQDPDIGAHLHWQVCTSSNFPRDLAQNVDPLKFKAWGPAAPPTTATVEQRLAKLEADAALTLRTLGGTAAYDYDYLVSLTNIQNSLNEIYEVLRLNAQNVLTKLEGKG